jgi:precorrin-6A/cobalt-precorrin-6A reductase
VVDATHPFAAQMSRNAVEGCAAAGVPLIALTRPAWEPVAGRPLDAGARHGGRRRGARPATGAGDARDRAAEPRDFAPHPQHFYLLRLVDPPAEPLPFPDAHVIVDRGPFDAEADRR